jgi:hypothetical protein
MSKLFTGVNSSGYQDALLGVAKMILANTTKKE